MGHFLNGNCVSVSESRSLVCLQGELYSVYGYYSYLYSTGLMGFVYANLFYYGRYYQDCFSVFSEEYCRSSLVCAYGLHQRSVRGCEE